MIRDDPDCLWHLLLDLDVCWSLGLLFGAWLCRGAMAACSLVYTVQAASLGRHTDPELIPRLRKNPRAATMSYYACGVLNRRLWVQGFSRISPKCHVCSTASLLHDGE